MSTSIKGPAASEVKFDGSSLRIAIVHSRWNKVVIDALVAGTVATLKGQGVKDHNIVIQSVPGSFELPLACSKVISGSHVQAGATATDLLGGLNLGSSTPSLMSPRPASRSSTPAPVVSSMPHQPFDAVIAIGVLIKGATMHFEYISEAVSHALMRVQLDTGVPVIFGVLTALTDEQALERAGLGSGEKKGHNHGEDWALAAVEMASRTRRWAEGKF
ncbi:Lumazine synthase [Panus rudis PR-1116 ss-1]|nr:Lumazine synthase [Panus rudis PR-1116 ss-1]